MKKEYSVYAIDLDTPEGMTLDSNIKSSISIRVEVSDDNGIELKVLLDHNKALQNLGEFLKESISFNPGLLNGRRVSSINAAPGYLYEPSTIYNRFTPKENEVMALISEGEIDKITVDRIQMNAETFRTHSRKAFVRMNVKKRLIATRRYNEIKGEVFVRDADVKRLLSKIGLID